MDPELRTHTLLRIPDARCLETDCEPPAWVAQALQEAPWVVIRRTRPIGAILPVGVRGSLRHERFAAWLPQAKMLEHVTPQDLARQSAWVGAARRESIAALAALDAVAGIMRAHGLEGLWGPTGSVGFELATRCPSAHTASDLDLCVQLPGPPPVALARGLDAQLATLAARCDVLLETPCGAIALAEYAQHPGAYALRTPQGPRLVRSPAAVMPAPGSFMP